MIFRLTTACLGFFLLGSLASAADAPVTSAADLAASLSAERQDPTTYVRLRLETKQPSGGSKGVLQIQIKERHTKTSTDLVYQVLWPKERKGESVLLRKIGDRAATGSVLVPPAAARPLEASQMKDSLLGSDLSYEDVIENFFAWEHQSLAGTEAIDRVSCQILESKPGKGERSSYASVRTWVDTRRLVPLRIEKYNAAGQLVRRIDTTDVAKDGARHIPANLTVQGPRKDSVTELDGSHIKHDVLYTDRDFTPEGLAEVTAPRSAPE